MKQEELKTRLEEIKNKLTAIEQPRENRIYLLCESENACAVNRFLFEKLNLRFVTDTGIDADDCFEVLYHFANDETGTFVTTRAFIRDREKPSIESLAPFIPAAEWVEREVHDILGIDFKNHPNLRRLILSDDWPEGVYPLRKACVLSKAKELEKELENEKDTE